MLSDTVLGIVGLVRGVPRILGLLIAAPLLTLFVTAGPASAQTPPVPVPDPIQTILTVFSPWTTAPCQLVATASVAGQVPGVTQAFQLCASFPVPPATPSCSVDNQIAGAAKLPTIVPAPTPEGNAVDSVGAVQQAVGGTAGQSPPDVAGQLGQALQCTPKTPGSDQAAPNGSAPSESSPSAVEGTTTDAGTTPEQSTPLVASGGDLSSGVASVPASPQAASVPGSATPPQVLRSAAATSSAASHAGWLVLLGAVALVGIGLWSVAGRGPADLPNE